MADDLLQHYCLRVCLRPLCGSRETTPRNWNIPLWGCVWFWSGWLSRRVTAVIASRKRPVPFRTRKLSSIAPMVLHSGGCGRVGRRRTSSLGVEECLNPCGVFASSTPFFHARKLWGRGPGPSPASVSLLVCGSSVAQSVFWLLEPCVDGVLGRQNAHCATDTTLRPGQRPLRNGHRLERAGTAHCATVTAPGSWEDRALRRWCSGPRERPLRNGHRFEAASTPTVQRSRL